MKENMNAFYGLTSYWKIHKNILGNNHRLAEYNSLHMEYKQ